MMRYKVVRETRWGDSTIAIFKSKESAKMFLEEYKKLTAHVEGELKIIEEKVVDTAKELAKEIIEAAFRK